MSSMIDWSGRKLGKLTAIAHTGVKDKRGAYIWEFSCDCGNTITAVPDKVRRNNIPSCGCALQKHKTLHGKTGTKEYSIWVAMKQRCSNPNHPCYADYGGRGITVCDRWSNSFESFLEDMGPKPEKLTLERINNSKGYSPENCKWDTRANQIFNRRRSSLNKSGKTGVHSPRDGLWEARIRDGGKITILYSGPSKEDAIVAVESAEIRLFGKLRGN